MEPNRTSSTTKIDSINNTKILEIINDLTKLKNFTKDNIVIKGLDEAIKKLRLLTKAPKNTTVVSRNTGLSPYSPTTKTTNQIRVNLLRQELKYKAGKYVGEVSNGLAEGKGESFFNNGAKYEGDCKSGNAEGKGTKEYNNGDKYEGDYKNDRREGRGIYCYKNGDRYEGHWKKGSRNHYGVYSYHNGDSYDGSWRDDKKDGKGNQRLGSSDRRGIYRVQERRTDLQLLQNAAENQNGRGELQLGYQKF
jgi:hypothetical protein